MNILVVNSIANFERNARLAEKFEKLLEDYKRRVVAATADFMPVGDLKKIYVQYQFDAAGAPNATRGMKIGRYSSRHQHVEGTVEVSREAFDDTDDRTRIAVLASLLIDVLRQMELKLDGRVSNNVSELLSLVEQDARLLETH